MKILTILLSIFLFTSCATWSKGDKIREATWMVLHVVDYKQTQYAMDRPDEFKELNPLLGEHPSEGRLNTLAIVGGLFHILVTDYLEENRTLWQNITIGLKVVCVVNNYYVGARVTY